MPIVSTLPSRVFGCRELAVDIETTSTQGEISSPWKDRILSIAISDGQDVWILRENFEQIVPVIQNPMCVKVFHNAMFDLSFLRHNLGVEPANIFDTLLAERLLHAGLADVRHSLDNLLARRVGVSTDKSIRSSFMNHAGEFTDEQIRYIETDVRYLLPIYQQQQQELQRDGLERVADLEFSLIPVVVDMYLEGVGFDLALWEQYQKIVSSQVRDQTLKIASYLGATVQQGFWEEDYQVSINLASVPQRLEIFRKLGIPLKSTGQAEIEEYLDSLREQGIPATDIRVVFLTDLLLWSRWNTMQRWAYDKEINPATGRIHPHWNQLEAATGRFSCSSPNLQNIPARPLEGEPDFRQLFHAGEDNWVLVDVDYNQQEPRIFAELCGDPNMRAACSERDVYAGFAKIVLGREPDPQTNERWVFKTGTLAAGYGAGVARIARVLGTNQKTAEQFMQAIRRSFPGMRIWGERQVSFVSQYGYCTTLLGRRRYFPDYKRVGSEKLRTRAINSPVQGSGADMIKMAMVMLYNRLKHSKLRSKIIITVHDELVLKAHRDDAQEVLEITKSTMEQAGQEICPHVRIVADGHITERWAKN